AGGLGEEVREAARHAPVILPRPRLWVAAMTSLDYEAEYNNSARVPEFPEIAARWEAASAAYREVAPADLDLPYGPGERRRYDLFHAAAAAAPVLVYVDGGYWHGCRSAVDALLARGHQLAGRPG